ncbi:LamG-like jellyroll fold domain-containing protein [Streptomyces sp. NPDC050600]|uniref:LamG-like jellyroll fold domain-containing protein n=1 Tax=Streptomyces sp. NPDC050600 TaxID=3157213 RepID=UPI00343642E0
MSGTFRKRGLLLGSCLAAVVGATAVPGTAYAADNLPPNRPAVKDLQTDFTPCATGDPAPYFSGPPVLTAVLSDPAEDDRPGYPEQVSGEFEIWWTDPAGVDQRRSYSSYPAYSGRLHRYEVPSDIPADTVISWRVRANDGTANGPWSSDAPDAACRFVYDNANPATPTVTSPEYPNDYRISDGVGVYGSFTMDSTSPDVVSYRYNFSDGTARTVQATEPGAPVTVRYMPPRSGTYTLSVEAFDRAGRSSNRTDYMFRVAPGRAPVSHWKLADPAGSTTATAETGSPAQAGTGVTFGGPAPQGTPLTSTARLDGSSHGYLTTGAPAVDTGKTFAVGAWVRPARTDRAMTVAGQDTDSGSGFALGLEGKDTGAAWTFAIGDAKVSGGAPETGEWAHLLGVYDAETGRAQLYVNGREVGTAAEASPVAAGGAFQIGRVRDGSGYKQRWQGEIGDLRTYDRVVVPKEVGELAQRKPSLLGHWSFETAADGATPEQNGGAPLKLGAGATIYKPTSGSCFPGRDPDCAYQPPALVDTGDLRLDGAGGHAALDGPVVNTGDSFTLGVVVQIPEADANRPMTVLSQAGEHTEAFKLRYEPSTYAWQLIMPERDEAGAPEKVVSQITGPAGSSGQGVRLAVVYDDATDTVKLFADGFTNAQATAHVPDGWKSGGPLQVGRGMTADGWGEYLKGDVDEIQAYAGALRDDDIVGLGWGTDPCLC